MLTLVARRVIRLGVVLAGVSLVTFAILHVTPSTPASADALYGDSRRSVRNRAMTWSAGEGAWGGGTATYCLSAALVRGPMMPSIGPGS